MAKQASTGLLWAIGIALIVLGVVYFYINPQTKVVETLKIGVVAPLSGDFEARGIQMKNAYDLALVKINEQGGIDGKTVEIIYKDGACNSDQARSVATELLETDSVDAILGGGCLVENAAVSEVTKAAGVVFISPTFLRTTEEKESQVFSTYPDATKEAEIIAQKAYENKQIRAAVLYQNNEITDAVRDTFNNVYQGDVLFESPFEVQEDLDMMMKEIRGKNPQMIFVIPNDVQAGAMVLDTLKRNWFNVGVYATDSIVNTQAFLDTPSSFEELLITDIQIGEGENSIVFLADYEAAYGGMPESPVIAAGAYDGLMLLAEALTNTTGDSQAIAEYLSSQINAYSGAVGVYSFGDNGVSDFDPVLLQVVGGEMKRVIENTAD